MPSTGEFLTDCSNAGLTAIPENFPNITTHLLLNDNNFNAIRNKTFTNLNKLVWLDISNSSVYQMEKKAFMNLENLGVLLLKNNHLTVKNGSYADCVFCPLQNQLEILDIRGNLRELTRDFKAYPDEALSCLGSLEILRLDCISDRKLSNGLSKMLNLKQLDFSDGTQALNIPDDMFNSVSQLNIELVNFTNVNIGRIHGKVFSVLKSLKILDLTNNPELRNITVDIALSLKQTSIEELYLNSTCLGVTASTDQLMESLNGTNLKVLSLDWNEIPGIDEVFSENVPQLEALTLRHNDLYEHFDLMSDIFKLPNLRVLDMSYQQTNSPSICRNQEVKSRSHKFVHKSVKHRIKTKEPLNGMAKFCLEDEACPIQFPKKLEWVAATHNGVHFTQLPELVLMNNGTLKYLDVSNNGIQSILKPLYCARAADVYSTVEHLDMSNCGIDCVNKTSTNYCTYSVKFFNLSENKLGLLKGKCNRNPKRDFLTFIKPLTTLSSLDISSNYISFLYNDSFEGLDNLRELRISNNKLTSWAPNMNHFFHLELLDLSYNYLATLSESTLLMLDHLEGEPQNRTKQHIFLNLEGNPIACVCENLHFLTWLLSTDIILLNIDQYRCIYHDGKEVKLSRGIHKIVTDLETECTDNLWLILSTTGLILHFTLVTLATLLYRYRHYLHYLVLRIRMRRERLDAMLGRENVYVYDAFISCTREGAKWVKNNLLPKLENGEIGLKFCVAQRDFIVGRTIIDNIMDSINKSRKTILLINQSFIDSKWCNEELLLSHHVSILLCVL